MFHETIILSDLVSLKENSYRCSHWVSEGNVWKWVQAGVTRHLCYNHVLCMHTMVMYISWDHVYLTWLCIPYVGMMYGSWQQSLMLYAQLLFAPAVNPQVEHGKQKRAGSVWEQGLSMTQGQSYSGLHLWLYINNMDWESIRHWAFHGDNACRSKCPHLAAVAQKSAEEMFFTDPEVRTLTFRSLSSLND